LTVDYRVNKVWCLSTSSYEVEFGVWATGGDCKITYYRDIDKIAGPTSGDITYRYKWLDCGGMPGTFFAKSGDGQEALKHSLAFLAAHVEAAPFGRQDPP
jgi:hypothetical protein